MPFWLSLPSERCEHWRRLRDWSFCPSEYTMTNNSNAVIAPTAQCWLLHFHPSPAVKWLFLLPPFSLCLNHFTWQRYALSRAPSSFSFNNCNAIPVLFHTVMQPSGYGTAYLFWYAHNFSAKDGFSKAPWTLRCLYPTVASPRLHQHSVNTRVLVNFSTRTNPWQEQLEMSLTQRPWTALDNANVICIGKLLPFHRLEMRKISVGMGTVAMWSQI